MTGSHSIRVAMGMPSSTVRVTVHSRSCDFFTASGRIALAASPASPSGNETRNVTSRSVRWLPPSSRTFSASTRTSNTSGSARREVRRSTSIDVQPPIAASSNSTGVKSVPAPAPTVIWPPWSLLAMYLLGPMRSMRTPRRAESVVMAPTLPYAAAVVSLSGAQAEAGSRFRKSVAALGERWSSAVPVSLELVHRGEQVPAVVEHEVRAHVVRVLRLSEGGPHLPQRGVGRDVVGRSGRDDDEVGTVLARVIPGSVRFDGRAQARSRRRRLDWPDLCPLPGNDGEVAALPVARKAIIEVVG